MPVKAITKNVRTSPRKVSVVASLVRGRSVADALTILENTPRRSAKVVLNTVKSAKANAEHDHGLKPDTLFISQISVTPGPRYKRFRAAARGRALRYTRSTSHIAVEVDGEKRQVKKPAAKPAEAKEEAK
jgi:large subunit ribosomal protein L22